MDSQKEDTIKQEEVVSQIQEWLNTLHYVLDEDLRYQNEIIKRLGPCMRSCQVDDGQINEFHFKEDQLCEIANDIRSAVRSVKYNTYLKTEILNRLEV